MNLEQLRADRIFNNLFSYLSGIHFFAEVNFLSVFLLALVVVLLLALIIGARLFFLTKKHLKEERFQEVAAGENMEFCGVLLTL